MLEYASAPSSIWVYYAIIPREERAGKIANPKHGHAKTTQISGHGLHLHSPEIQLAIGMILELEIDLSNASDPILALGRVGEVHRDEDDLLNYFVEFTMIEERDRDKIIGHVMQHGRSLK